MTSGAVTLWLAGHPRIRRAVVAMTLSYTLSRWRCCARRRQWPPGGRQCWVGLGCATTRACHQLLLPVPGVGARGRHQQRPKYFVH